MILSFVRGQGALCPPAGGRERSDHRLWGCASYGLARNVPGCSSASSRLSVPVPCGCWGKSLPFVLPVKGRAVVPVAPVRVWIKRSRYRARPGLRATAPVLPFMGLAVEALGVSGSVRALLGAGRGGEASGSSCLSVFTNPKTLSVFLRFRTCKNGKAGEPLIEPLSPFPCFHDFEFYLFLHLCQQKMKNSFVFCFLWVGGRFSRGRACPVPRFYVPFFRRYAWQ